MIQRCSVNGTLAELSRAAQRTDKDSTTTRRDSTHKSTKMLIIAACVGATALLCVMLFRGTNRNPRGPSNTAADVTVTSSAPQTLPPGLELLYE